MPDDHNIANLPLADAEDASGDTPPSVNSTSSSTIQEMVLFKQDEEVIVRESIRVFIKNIDPRSIDCEKQIWRNGAWASFSHDATTAPTTKLDLNLDKLDLWQSVPAPGGKTTREVIQIRFELDPACKARFDPRLAVSSGDPAGKDFLRHCDVDQNTGQKAIFSSLRRPMGAGPLPFNLGLWVKDGAHEMLVFYDPKIENDGTILSPPPPPPPPPPEWPGP